MQKIPTIFERDWNGDRSRVVNRPHKDCGWVFAGEGVATRKLDGTCCMIRDGMLFRRRELKAGQVAPPDFEAVSADAETGKIVGWVPVQDGPEDKWHRAAFKKGMADGTYELVGPHSQGNVEKREADELVSHLSPVLAYPNAQADAPPRDFNGLREWMNGKDIEGLVFHHPDGRMAKIKLRDFGLKRVVSLRA